MAFTLRQFYITLKKRERETHSGSETSKTFTGKKEKEKKDDQQVHTGPAGTNDSSCDRRRRRVSKRPPLSPQHTQATKGREGRGRWGGAGREKYGGGVMGGGSLFYDWSWTEIGSIAGAACLWLKSGHVSTLWLLISMSSRQSQLFDCLLIGQFVVFKQPREDSV